MNAHNRFSLTPFLFLCFFNYASPLISFKDIHSFTATNQLTPKVLWKQQSWVFRDPSLYLWRIAIPFSQKWSSWYFLLSSIFVFCFFLVHYFVTWLCAVNINSVNISLSSIFHFRYLHVYCNKETCCRLKGFPLNQWKEGWNW